MAAGEKYIEIRIGPDGTTRIEAFGFPDGSCLKETQDLEEALGKVTKRTLKSEASKKTTIADKTQVKGK